LTHCNFLCYHINMNTKLIKPTVTRNFRLPKPLLERIAILAQKRKWSINAWVVNTLEREANKSH